MRVGDPRAAARSAGVEVRVGLHTGEVDLRGDDIGGLGVHVAQRVCALASPGEVSSPRQCRSSSQAPGSHSRTAASNSSKGSTARGGWPSHSADLQGASAGASAGVVELLGRLALQEREPGNPLRRWSVSLDGVDCRPDTILFGLSVNAVFGAVYCLPRVDGYVDRRQRSGDGGGSREVQPRSTPLDLVSKSLIPDLSLRRSFSSGFQSLAGTEVPSSSCIAHVALLPYSA